MEATTVTTRARFLTVRFEDSCVLIPPPDLSKPGIRPRLIRKSYSLPLWKASPSKKATPASQDSVAIAEPDPIDGDKADKKAFSLTVSVPSLTIKSKSRRPSLPPSPCLSKRNLNSPTSPTSSDDVSPPPPLLRTPSFPAILPASTREAATVPLRPCCEACHHCVDAALAEGERWAERWSKGAMRRYSEGEHAQLHASPLFGVTREWKPKGSDLPLASALQVDEVEVRRRASDAQDNAPGTDEDALADSEEDSPPVLPMPVHFDEDEDMLFPLPSPRRSPNPSPYATPLSGSQVSLTAPKSIPDATPKPVESPVSMGSLTTSQPAVASPVPARIADTVTPPTRDLSAVSSNASRTSPRSEQASPLRLRQRSASSPAPQTRRPSFSSASGSLLKGSAAVLKGVAAGMTGAATAVGR